MPHKKKPNKANLMVYKAFSKALKNNEISIYIDDTKINKPGSSVYNPWEFLLPKLIPIIVGLAMLYFSIFFGLSFIILSIILNDKIFKKKLDVRLFDRTKSYVIKSFENLEEIWNSGGIILSIANNKKKSCLSPDDDWKEFIIKNFSELMVDKKEVAEVKETKKERKYIRKI